MNGALLRAQGVPSVARAAAVTGIHDPAFLETLADAAIKAMPHLSAADICSVVESFSGAPRGVHVVRDIPSKAWLRQMCTLLAAAHGRAGWWCNADHGHQPA